jgi:hypothetical protein
METRIIELITPRRQWALATTAVRHHRGERDTMRAAERLPRAYARCRSKKRRARCGIREEKESDTCNAARRRRLLSTNGRSTSGLPSWIAGVGGPQARPPECLRACEYAMLWGALGGQGGRTVFFAL